MKDTWKNRIKRLEEIVKQRDDVLLVALHDQDGFHWNGATYANQEALSYQLHKKEKNRVV